LHKLVLLAVFMQAANGIRPATAQHDSTHTPRPTLPSCCAVVRSVFIETRKMQTCGRADRQRVKRGVWPKSRPGPE